MPGQLLRRDIIVRLGRDRIELARADACSHLPLFGGEADPSYQREPYRCPALL